MLFGLEFKFGDLGHFVDCEVDGVNEPVELGELRQPCLHDSANSYHY